MASVNFLSSNSVASQGCRRSESLASSSSNVHFGFVAPNAGELAAYFIQPSANTPRLTFKVSRLNVPCFELNPWPFLLWLLCPDLVRVWR